MDWKNIFGQCSLVLRLFLNAFRILFFALYHLKFSVCVFFFLHNVLTMNWIVFILHHRICLSQANEGFGAYLSRVRQLTLRTCCWKLICLSSTSVSANTEHKNLKVHLKGSSEGFIWSSSEGLSILKRQLERGRDVMLRCQMSHVYTIICLIIIIFLLEIFFKCKK